MNSPPVLLKDVVRYLNYPDVTPGLLSRQVIGFVYEHDAWRFVVDGSYRPTILPSQVECAVQFAIIHDLGYVR